MAGVSVAKIEEGVRLAWILKRRAVLGMNGTTELVTWQSGGDRVLEEQ